MDIKIGEKIIELRKEKKLTQEQLANILGVSAPAVSKWETDSSYPDITLLCPLARALGTDVDTLLSYEETLSEEEQGRYITEIIALAREGKAEEAEERLEQLLHSYPSSVSLQFSAIAVYSLLEMNSSSGSPDKGNGAAEKEKAEKERERWRARRKKLAGAVYASGDPAYRPSAISMLVSLELADGQLDRAEELLKQTLADTGDFTMLWVQLYQKKGEQDKALDTVQRSLYKRVGEMRTCLMAMLGSHMEFGRERTLEICDVFRRQEELFGVGGGTGVGVIAEVYLRLGMKEEALACLEEFTDRLAKGLTLPNQALFHPAFSPETMGLQASAELRQVVLNGLEQDECLEELRGGERFQAMVSRLKGLSNIRVDNRECF